MNGYTYKLAVSNLAPRQAQGARAILKIRAPRLTKREVWRLKKRWIEAYSVYQSQA